MSRRPKQYHVEWRNHEGQWFTLNGSSGTRQYCEGWVAALDSAYPCDPLRIIAEYNDHSIEVVRETRGRSRAHV
jgi:hypothetical protein